MSGRISAQGAHGIIRIAAHDTRRQPPTPKSTPTANTTARTVLLLPRTACRNNRRAINPDTFAAELLQTRLNSEPLALQRGDHFLDLLDTAIAAQPRAIGFAQGLPDRETLALIREQGILTFAIVGTCSKR